MISNAILRSRAIELRLWPEKHIGEINFFLDPSSLVEGLLEEAEVMQSNISIDIGQVAAGETGIRPIPKQEMYTES
jgi:hypothetical protein